LKTSVVYSCENDGLLTRNQADLFSQENFNSRISTAFGPKEHRIADMCLVVRNSADLDCTQWINLPTASLAQEIQSRLL
jgi:hypothetical protein